MKDIKILSLVCGLLARASCEKVVMDDTVLNPGQENGTARLSVTTRSGEEGTENVADGRVYVFNQAGACVQLLTTNEDQPSATVSLNAGTYTVCAVGGEDLSRFSLPTKAEATKTSVVSPAAGKVMDDLMMKSMEVTIESGKDQDLSVILERKVLSLEKLELKAVPSDVTKVELTLSPFYTNIRLDGSYDDSVVEDYKVELTKQADGTTWSATPKKVLLPSKGVPTITILLTTTTGTEGYSYTAEQAMTANHKISISGTYNVSRGAKVTATLRAATWGEDQAVEFGVDGSSVVYRPVQGTFCNGYYVVSVNATDREAVLLAKEKLIEYTAPTGEAATSASAWRTAMTEPMAALAKPTGIEGSWRLPTLAEVRVFSQDTQIVSFGSLGYSPLYFCDDNGTLKWAQTHKTDSDFELNQGSSGFNASMRLRPVIDISY